MVPGNMDGCPPNIQRASHPLHEQGQGSRRSTAHADEDAWNRPREGKSRSNSLCPRGCTIWKQIMVGPERNRQTRGSSTPSESAGQVNPWRSAHDATSSTDERFRTDTCASRDRLQAATISGKARKHMRRLPAKGDVQPPHIWRSDMQSHQHRAQTRPGGTDDAAAPPGRSPADRDRPTERSHSGKERSEMLGEIERGHGGCGGLYLMERLIAIR